MRRHEIRRIRRLREEKTIPRTLMGLSGIIEGKEGVFSPDPHGDHAEEKKEAERDDYDRHLGRPDKRARNEPFDEVSDEGGKPQGGDDRQRVREMETR